MLLSHTRAGAKYGETKKGACMCAFIIASMAKDMHSSLSYHAMRSWLLPAYFHALSRVLPLHLYLGWPRGRCLIRNYVHRFSFSIARVVMWRVFLEYYISQACSGQLMSHNTYDNIVKNKGNIDYCIEVLFSCHDFTDFIPCNIRQLRIMRTIGLALVRIQVLCFACVWRKPIPWPRDSKFGSFWRETTVCFSSAIRLHWEPHQVHEGHVRRRPLPCLKNEIVCGIGYLLFTDGLRTNRLTRRDGLPTNWSSRSLK